MLQKILQRSAEEIAKNIGKNAAIGGAVDGIIGVIDGKNIAKEVGCGVVTSGSGAAAREAFEYFVKEGSKWSHVVSIGASIGARYVYRRSFGDLEDGNETERVINE